METKDLQEHENLINCITSAEQLDFESYEKELQSYINFLWLSYNEDPDCEQTYERVQELEPFLYILTASKQIRFGNFDTDHEIFLDRDETEIQHILEDSSAEERDYYYTMQQDELSRLIVQYIKMEKEKQNNPVHLQTEKSIDVFQEECEEVYLKAQNLKDFFETPVFNRPQLSHKVDNSFYQNSFNILTLKFILGENVKREWANLLSLKETMIPRIPEIEMHKIDND
jgi:hypothetical protein